MKNMMSKMVALLTALVMVLTAAAFAEDIMDNETAEVIEEIVEIIEVAEEIEESEIAEEAEEIEEVEIEAVEETEEIEVIEETEETEIPEDAILFATIEDALDENRRIEIYVSFAGEDIYFGDIVTLTAVAVGYENVVYTLQWQVSADNASWSDIAGANGGSYSFAVTADNYNNFWRVTLTATEAK